MSATSVTGKGLGMSNGLYKPELHCGGCGCGSAQETTPAQPPAKIGCYTRLKSGNTLGYKGCKTKSTQVCS